MYFTNASKEVFKKIAEDDKIITLQSRTGAEKKVRKSLFARMYHESTAEEIKLFEGGVQVNDENKAVEEVEEVQAETVEEVKAEEVQAEVVDGTIEVATPTPKAEKPKAEKPKIVRKMLFKTTALKEFFFRAEPLGIDLPLGLKTNEEAVAWASNALEKLQPGEIEFGLKEIQPADFAKAVSNSTLSYTENRVLLLTNTLTAQEIENKTEQNEKMVDKYLKAVKMTLMHYYKMQKVKEYVAANKPANKPAKKEAETEKRDPATIV